MFHDGSPSPRGSRPLFRSRAASRRCCLGDRVHVRIRAARVSADLCFAEASPLIRTLGINGRDASTGQASTDLGGGRSGRALSQKARVGISPSFGNAGLPSSPKSERRVMDPVLASSTVNSLLSQADLGGQTPGVGELVRPVRDARRHARPGAADAGTSDRSIETTERSAQTAYHDDDRQGPDLRLAHARSPRAGG